DSGAAPGARGDDPLRSRSHATPGSQGRQALAGVRMCPAWQSVTGVALLAAESDEALMQRFTPEQWRNLAPHVAQQRQRGYVLWHHADGEVSMAQPLGKHAAALAFAGMWRIDEAEAAARLQALKALNQLIAQ
ncbi:IclR family transcriptional regulator, partial [Salmonella enterica]|uniref:IclR family transcriptional regulator n=1 Tax=Salmonella enterica TaxID=28901 RepID=UPI001081CDB0